MSLTALPCLKVITVLLLFCFLVPGSTLNLEIHPQFVNALITSDVSITCTANNSPSLTQSVVAIDLGEEGERPLVVLQQSQLKHGAGFKSNMKAEGHIDLKNVTQSFVRLTITKPSVDDSGQYMCSMYYLDELGEMKNEKVYANLTVENQNNHDVVKFVMEKLAAVETLLQQQQNKTADQQREIETLKIKHHDETKALKNETKALKNETDALKSENNALKEQLEDETKALKNETKALKNETKALKNENNALKEQLEDETNALKNETKALKSETKALKSKNNALKEQLEDETNALKNETKALKSETKALKNETATLRNENNALKEQFEDKTTAFKNETKVLKKQLEDETKALGSETKALKKQLVEQCMELTKLENQTSELIMKETFKSAFMVGVNRSAYDTYQRGQTMTYQVVKLNVGGHYDPNTGVYTAPVDGLYVFHVLGIAANDHDLILGLRVNRRTVSSFLARDRDGEEQASLSAIVQLATGDRVDVYVSNATDIPRTTWGYPWDTFSGILIQITT